jgi:flagellin-like protein
VVRPIEKKRGLSEVVSTLILLVVTILLAGVVTYYATNVTTVRTETEEVRISKAHIWVNDTGAVGAFKVQNLGGKDVLLDKITVRGVEETWSDVYYFRVPSGTVINGDMNRTTYEDLDVAFEIIDTNNYTRASADIPLISGGELLVYIKGPDNVQMDDIGTTVSISIFTANAQYHNGVQRRVRHRSVIGRLATLPTKEQYLEDYDVS